MQASSQSETGASNSSDLAGRVRALAPMLADADPRVRKSAVIALGRMGCPEATRELCACLDDRVEGVRVLACQALGRAADPASIPALLARVHDESAEVRAGILWALANVVAHGNPTDEVRRALFSPIVVMAFDPDDGVRADAAAVLGSLRDPRCADALAVLLEDGQPRVRANACASLGLLDDAAGFEALLTVAENPSEDPLVLVSALDGLARRAERGGPGHEDLQADRAVKAVCALTRLPEGPRSSSPEGTSAADVRATAAWALGLMAPLAPGCGAAAVEVLADSLDSGDSWTQRYAIEALARIHNEEARLILDTWAKRLEAEGRVADEDTARVLRQALETFEAR